MSLITLPTEIIQHLCERQDVVFLVQLSQVDQRLRMIALKLILFRFHLDCPYDLPPERLRGFIHVTILNLSQFFRTPLPRNWKNSVAFQPNFSASMQDINKITSIQVVALGSLEFLNFFLTKRHLTGSEILEIYRASCILKYAEMSRFLLEKLKSRNFSELDLLRSTYRMGISSNDALDPMQLVEKTIDNQICYEKSHEKLFEEACASGNLRAIKHFFSKFIPPKKLNFKASHLLAAYRVERSVAVKLVDLMIIDMGCHGAILEGAYTTKNVTAQIPPPSAG